MDLGCLDMGCVERRSGELSPDNESTSNSSSSDSVMATFKIGKNKGMKDASHSSLSTLNKCTSQIRKPSRRKTSPLNWFPRKKVDSYLKRKIQSLQEVDGMNSTLDETLGDSNLHYSKVLREKIAVREAAAKAMEARKAAMVEASWCKILHAAGIECKVAEARLLEAEKIASDAFEAATSIGVIMYDTADCPRKYCRIETSAAKEGSTHAVSASFETAFEVDRQVGCAVKVAFTKLATCSSINKDECREILRKISQNPDSEEIFQELASSECESDTGSEIEMGLNEDSLNNDKKDLSLVRQMRLPNQASENFNTSNLVGMMLERLKSLHEDELASLATIVATCGLNAALTERGEGRHKQYESDPNLQVQTELLESSSSTDGGQKKRGVAAETELPSLDKFLVKRLTRLEKEVLEAKNTQKNEARDENQQKLHKSELPSLDKFLIKRLTRLEREVLEAKTTQKNEARDEDQQKLDKSELPSLDKFFVKRLTRLEREVLEAKNAQKNESRARDDNENAETCTKLERETEEATKKKNEIVFKTNRNKLVKRVNLEAKMPSLDRFLIKHVSRLEKEVLEAKNRRIHEGDNSILKTKNSISAAPSRTGEVSSAQSDAASLGKENIDQNKNSGEESLDQILVKHKNRLEREKLAAAAAAAAQQSDDQMNNHHSITRREAREKEIQEAWGGLSLGNSIRPHISKLQRDKINSSGDQFRHSSVVVRKEAREKELQETWGGLSLGNSIKPHVSKLERHKKNTKSSEEDQIVDRHSSSSVLLHNKESREKELLQDSWGGLSLGNSIRPHLSRLQRDKAAWLKAEEEERRARIMEG